MIEENDSHWIISGTSAAAPAFAGLMALVVDKMGGVGQGSANPRLYSLVNAESNPFHATLSGNNSVPGVAGFWANGATYNLATGLGSVDASALVGSWSSKFQAPPTLELSVLSASIAVAQGGTATITFAAVTGGSFAGSIGFSPTGIPSGLTATWSANPITVKTGESTNTATLSLKASRLAVPAEYSFTVTAAGDGLSSTQTVTVQVLQPRFCKAFVRSTCSGPVQSQIGLLSR
jgi:hypothetical protein